LIKSANITQYPQITKQKGWKG